MRSKKIKDFSKLTCSSLFPYGVKYRKCDPYGDFRYAQRKSLAYKRSHFSEPYGFARRKHAAKKHRTVPVLFAVKGLRKGYKNPNGFILQNGFTFFAKNGFNFNDRFYFLYQIVSIWNFTITANYSKSIAVIIPISIILINIVPFFTRSGKSYLFNLAIIKSIIVYHLNG